MVPLLATVEIKEDEERPVAEIVASFSGTDLLRASQESSAQYRGIVIAQALRIAIRKTDYSLPQMAEAIGYTKTAIYRIEKALPISMGAFDRWMSALASVCKI